MERQSKKYFQGNIGRRNHLWKIGGHPMILLERLCLLKHDIERIGHGSIGLRNKEVNNLILKGMCTLYWMNEKKKTDNVDLITSLAEIPQRECRKKISKKGKKEDHLNEIFRVVDKKSAARDMDGHYARNSSQNYSCNGKYRNDTLIYSGICSQSMFHVCYCVGGFIGVNCNVSCPDGTFSLSSLSECSPCYARYRCNKESTPPIQYACNLSTYSCSGSVWVDPVTLGGLSSSVCSHCLGATNEV